MIKTIRMKNCATYQQEGGDIENCQKINFFYGANGSGKSTISNFLLEQTEPQYGQCEIEWYNNSTTDILVYNKEFRKRNFKKNIAGVFTLGRARIEEIEELEQLKKERLNKNEEYFKRKNTFSDKDKEEERTRKEFRDAVWNVILKRNEEDFREAFSGYRTNKDKFMEQVIAQYKKSHLSNETREDLKKRYNMLYSRKPEKCDMIVCAIKDLIITIQTIEKDEIWGKVIVGNNDLPISKLIEHLDNADWVNQGRSYIREEGICPFCQQKTITSDFKNQLNDFFSGEYEENIQHLKIIIPRYINATEQLIRNLEAICNNTKIIDIGGIDISKYDSLKESLKATFLTIISKMSNKEKEPSKKIVLSSSHSIIYELNDMIVSANQEIVKHNKMVDNYNDEKKSLYNDIWSYLISEHESLIVPYLKQIEQLQKAKSGIQKGIEEAKKQLISLENAIIEAGKNITSVQPTVDEINRLLKAYGFTNFRIVPSPTEKNAYQIQRMDGTLATNTLSEGEETFILFLYFMQLVKGSVDASKVSTRKIIVLDDPICSLDSTVLYIVSSMVRTLIKDIREGISDVEQIFILTHNVFFHKEASFVDGRTTVLNDVNYWIINKDNNTSTIRSFGKNNPIKTSYELLWQELKTNTNASLVTTQNIMRRILENYFSMLGKNIDETVIKSFESVEDQIICRSLISWINDGSHSIPDDLYIDSYADSVARYKEIFKQIFIKMDHAAHYEMMMT